MSDSSQAFDGLSNVLQNQFGLGESSNKSLDIITNGTVKKYGSLGNFASKFDQSAERRYLEQGYFKRDNFNSFPKQLEVLFQEPDLTVLVKKRAFSTLSENYRPDLMDADERLFYKATKILFQNKANQISTFEKLFKIQRVAEETGQLDTQLLPMLFTISDNMPSFLIPDKLKNDFSKLQSVMDKVRTVFAFSSTNNTTTWITDKTDTFKTQFGEGTGVLELTNIHSISTTTSVHLGVGSCTFSLVDPYEMMTITNLDIEQALSDATNQTYNHKIFQLGVDSLDKVYANTLYSLNNLRAARNANPINIVINPDSFLGKKITAIIDNIGYEILFTYDSTAGVGGIAPGSVVIQPQALVGSPDVLNDGLSKEEVGYLSDAIKQAYTSIQIKENSKSITSQNSKLTNYARKKLRLHYANKNIIQPMDQVHVFISSKSRIDNKILGGLQTSLNGFGFLQQLNNSVFDLKNSWDAIFNPSSNASIQLEKSIYVGADFPNYMWSILRNQFVNDKSGTHVFGGVVNNSVSSFSAGNGYEVKVDCKDNSFYFDDKQTNINPSLDNFIGPLYDPLTPFKTNFDTVSTNFDGQVPVLLSENSQLLNEKIIKYKAGSNVGVVASEKTLFQDTEKRKGGILGNVYYAPDGFAYRWKEGIGTYVQFGDSFSRLDPQTVGLQSQAQDPFAGQDVMNVISLLITGIPYNFNTFFKAAREFDNISPDPTTGQSPANSYYKSLTDKLIKKNSYWGNFIPFKSLSVDEKSYTQMLFGQASIQNNNSTLDQKLSEIQSLKYMSVQATGADKITMVNKLKLLQDEVDRLYKDYNKDSKGYSVIGSDVSFDADSFLNSDNKKLYNNGAARKELRKKLNALTRRLAWAVRSNTDKNLFIVDDSYDKDYDIAAYNKSLNSGMSQYRNEFLDVKQRIDLVARLLNLEVFCDSQGHIRVRPPQYNKVPSSVFNRMIATKNETGIEVYPKFLDKLFVNQLDSSLENIEIVEDQIRIDAATIGLVSDASISKFLAGKSADIKFNFMSDEATGVIINNSKLLYEKDPGVSGNSQASTFQSKLDGQLNIRNLFNPEDKKNVIVGSFEEYTTTDSSSEARIGPINQRLEKKTSQKVDLGSFYIEQNNIGIAQSKQIDLLKVINDISEKVADRQRLIKTAAYTLKNVREIKQVDNDPNIANKLAMPNANTGVPEYLQMMFEDESYDDYGPGSGSRFIIKDYQILNYSFREQPPPHTTIEISGLINPYDASNNVDGLNSFPGGGNGQTTAAAVDYDMWRMYGLTTVQNIQLPFLSNPITQSAPLAVAMLSIARKEIFSGDMTIAGNEFIQPGEVYYIENKDMLFYTDQVSHSFSEGGNFTTSMTLKYGHNPGEYIPTWLDIIGKLIYKNQTNSNTINYRQETALDQASLGAIAINTQNVKDLLFSGDYSQFNYDVIYNAIYNAGFQISRNIQSGNNIKSKLELRVYYDSKGSSSSLSDSEKVKYAADRLKEYIRDYAKQSLITGDDISVVEIDSSASNELRSPSQKAVELCRRINQKTQSGTYSPIKNTLYKYVIDMWISFEQKSS